MFKVVQEAYFFSRYQFQPLMLIALVHAIPAFVADVYLIGLGEDGLTSNVLLAFAIPSLCLKILCFAAAMLYIDGLSHERPIGIGQSFSIAFKHLFNLITLNIIRGCMTLVGLMIFIVPGIFLIYKLFFAELYVLLRNERIMPSMKSSFKDTTGFASELAPPMAFWAVLMLAAWQVSAIFVQPDADSYWLALVVHQALVVLLTIFGWALTYRLFQRVLISEVADD